MFEMGRVAMTLMPMMKGDHAWRVDTNLHTLTKEVVFFVDVEWGVMTMVMPWHAHYGTMYSRSDRGAAMETGDISKFVFISRKVSK